MSQNEKDMAVQPDQGVAVDPFSKPYSKTMAWMAVIAAMAFQLVGGGSLNMITPIMSSVLAEFGADTNFGATMSSIFTLVNIIMTVPTAWAINKWGFRSVGVVAYICLVLGALLGAMWVSDEASMIVVRIIQGLGYTVPFVLGAYVVTMWFPKDKQSLPIAMVGCMTYMCQVFTLQISKIAIPLAGWQGEFWAILIAAIIGFVLFFFFMKEGPGYEIAEAERKAKAEKKEKAGIGEVITSPYLWAICGVAFMYSVTTKGWAPFSNMIFVEACGVSESTASDLSTMTQFAKLPGALLVAWAMQKFLDKRGKIAAVFITVFFVAQSYMFLMSSAAEAWVCCTIIGLTGPVTTLCMICAPLFFDTPARLATALALYNTVGRYIAGLIAPYIISFSRGIFEGWVGGAVPCVIFGILGIGCAWFLGVQLDKFTKKQKAAEAEAAAA